MDSLALGLVIHMERVADFDVLHASKRIWSSQRLIRHQALHLRIVHRLLELMQAGVMGTFVLILGQVNSFILHWHKIFLHQVGELILNGGALRHNCLLHRRFFLKHGATFEPILAALFHNSRCVRPERYCISAQESR